MRSDPQLPPTEERRLRCQLAMAILVLAFVNGCSSSSPVASTNNAQNAALAKLDPNGPTSSTTKSPSKHDR